MARSILHIEKEESVKALLSALLKARGHHVEATESGKEALEIAARLKPDLIIVGEELADIDGIGLIVKIRSELPPCPLIFISKEWRDGAIYQQLKKDFKVDLVIHRPLKAGLLGAQIEGIFQEQKKIHTYVQVEQEEATFKTLQANYLKVLPERVDKLEGAIKLAMHNPDDLFCLIEAIRLAHNLKGTAASCGFGVLGESAGSLEKALSSIKENGLSKNEAAREEIELMVSLVRSNATALSGNPSAQVDKRAFATIEGGSDEERSLPPASGPAIPEDNFDTYDDSSAVRVLVVAKGGAESRVLTSRNGMKVQVIFAEDKEPALSRAKRLSLDAVLIDIDVESPAPSLNLARELRSLVGYETLPVAFLSSSRQPKDIEASTHAGASMVLAKKSEHEGAGGSQEFDQDSLLDAIEYLIAARQGGRPRILIVDEDEDFVKIVSSVLGQEGMLVKVLPSANRTLEEMRDFHPDLVLLDVSVPAVSGYDVCRLIRSKEQYQDLPVLFLTAATGLETRLAAFEAGADDYLPKPVAKVELLTRVKVRLDRSRLMKERSNTDVLSGLLIRRAFMEELQSMVTESERNGLIFSLALIDVDHFKNVNDTYGHMAGDRVLTSLGQLLRKRFRVEDVRGRWGGEEFIVAFRHIRKETAQGALQRALEELRLMEFQGDHGEIFSISFSAGIANYPDENTNIDDLLKIADEKLYKAKQAGRNCIIA